MRGWFLRSFYKSWAHAGAKCCIIFNIFLNLWFLLLRLCQRQCTNLNFNKLLFISAFCCCSSFLKWLRLLYIHYFKPPPIKTNSMGNVVIITSVLGDLYYTFAGNHCYLFSFHTIWVCSCNVAICFNTPLMDFLSAYIDLIDEKDRHHYVHAHRHIPVERVID